MSARTFAIVTVGEIGDSKSRLNDYLVEKDREKLILCMLNDVLDALVDMEKVIVVSPTDIPLYSRHYKIEMGSAPAEFIMEEDRKSLDGAVDQATFHAIQGGAEATLFVPGDVPLITRREVRKILDLGDRHGLVICPAKDGGTGMLYRRPPTIINNRFTSRSFYEHVKEAESKGVKVHIHYSTPFSLDIDTREDITDFMHLPSTATSRYSIKDTRTWQFLDKKF